MVTLKELSKLSGCSIRTVNRVLRHEGAVAESTRLKIEQLLEAHHYVPNMAARNLRREHRACIGILTSGEYESQVYLKKIYNLLVCLEGRGYYPLFGSHGAYGKLEPLLNDWSGLVRHILLMMPRTSLLNQVLALKGRYDFVFTILDAGEYPASALHEAGISSLSLNRTGGIHRVLNRLVDCGHKRVMRFGNIQNRDEGWRTAREHLEKQGVQIMHLRMPAEFDEGVSAGERIMAARPDAVFFDSDRAAFGFYRYAAMNGIEIPRQISVVGFDDDQAAVQVYPALSTLAHPWEKMNAVAAEIASGQQTGAVEVSLDMEFFERESICSR